MDAVPARLLVTSGPDEGKVFGLTADLVHIGTGDGNQVILSDEALAEHQASIASRNGRYAIYVPPGARVEVEGNEVPTDKWVWLPASAAMRLSETTFCRFESSVPAGVNSGGSGSVNATTVTTMRPVDSVPSEEGTPVGSEGRRREGGKRRKAAARKSQVARFITDRPGDPLVRLGEDGQLPELALSDTAERRQAEAPKEKNPLVLYAALTCSFVLSLGMLLVEPPASNVVNHSVREEARQELKEYFGTDESPLEPYQKELRLALVEAARGNTAAERRHYRRVLQMLNAADVRDEANLNGLTGRYTGRGRSSDADLRKILERLLGH